LKASNSLDCAMKLLFRKVQMFLQVLTLKAKKNRSQIYQHKFDLKRHNSVHGCIGFVRIIQDFVDIPNNGYLKDKIWPHACKKL